MVLTDHGYSYNGYTIDPTEAAPAALAMSWAGLRGYSTRGGLRALPRAHGASPGTRYQEARLFTFSVELRGEAETVEQEVDRFMAAFTLDSSSLLPFTWKHPGVAERFVRARPHAVDPGEFRHDGLHNRILTAQLEAPDPRIYSGTTADPSQPWSTTLQPYSSGGGGGLDYPVTDYPKEYTGGGTTGEKVVTNSGGTDAYPTFVIQGPTAGTTTRVKIINTTNGDVFDLLTNITVGEIVVADMLSAVSSPAVEPVTLNGASRYTSWQLPRTPLRLRLGDNILRMEVTGATAGVVAGVSWLSTWRS